MSLPLRLAVLAWFASFAAPAHAAVTASSPGAFQVEHKVVSKAAPAAVFAALGEVGRWWHGEHTFSGKAANLSLKLEAGGCFCERWADGSVEHGRVVQVAQRGKDRLVRLEAALGPARELAASGILTFSLSAQGTGSALVVTYRVAGEGELTRWAGPSDKVIGAQLARLVRFVETGKPE